MSSSFSFFSTLRSRAPRLPHIVCARASPLAFCPRGSNFKIASSWLGKVKACSRFSNALKDGIGADGAHSAHRAGGVVAFLQLLEAGATKLLGQAAGAGDPVLWALGAVLWALLL